MATKRLTIPNGSSNISLNKGVDSLTIEVNGDCTWCYSDPTPCFPNGLLPAGSYTVTNPHTEYGPYTPDAAGTVNFNSVTSGTCDPNGGPVATMHTIVVS
jgi:hypothetical protein